MAHRGLSFSWMVGGKLRSFPLPQRGSLTIGRGPEADVVIDATGVSRRHAQLFVDGDAVRVEDLDSANGTFVSGKRDDGDDGTEKVERRQVGQGERVVLHVGDLLQLGTVSCMLERSDEVSVRPPGHDDPIVVDPAMASVYAFAERIADAPISVLILGETGVGKEVLAETIVKRSRRASKPLMKLNCAAFPENLIESELFGYERGAFTGALKSKVGLLESADGGTVFLDEVGEIPLTTQAKLLRALEAREVMRLGAVQPRSIDVRFISATNRNLELEAREGRFREDLYFRLNGVTLNVPPLRERQSEIVPLARAFAKAACKAAGRDEVPTFSPEVVEAFSRYGWRGNIRELKNFVERAIALCRSGPIELSHLPPELTRAEASDAHSAPSQDVPPHDERARILWALDRCGGNQTRAAKLLGIGRTKFVELLDLYDVPRPRR